MPFIVMSIILQGKESKLHALKPIPHGLTAKP
jgi:hypothetical protein